MPQYEPAELSALPNSAKHLAPHLLRRLRCPKLLPILALGRFPQAPGRVLLDGQLPVGGRLHLHRPRAVRQPWQTGCRSERLPPTGGLPSALPCAQRGACGAARRARARGWGPEPGGGAPMPGAAGRGGARRARVLLQNGVLFFRELRAQFVSLGNCMHGLVRGDAGFRRRVDTSKAM